LQRPPHGGKRLFRRVLPEQSLSGVAGQRADHHEDASGCKRNDNQRPDKATEDELYHPQNTPALFPTRETLRTRRWMWRVRSVHWAVTSVTCRLPMLLI